MKNTQSAKSGVGLVADTTQKSILKFSSATLASKCTCAFILGSVVFKAIGNLMQCHVFLELHTSKLRNYCDKCLKGKNNNK